MRDCGLKDYRSIEEPEYVEAVLDPYQQRTFLNEYLVDFFREVLEVQQDTGAQLWFDWVPDRVLVYSTKVSSWHTTGAIDLIVDASFEDRYTLSSLDSKIDELYDSLHSWREKKLEVKNEKN